MRKLILSTNTSLDGFVEGPNHELDWTVADEELHDFYADLLSNADLILFGRIVYGMMVDYWPNAVNDPSVTGGMKRFAEALNPMKKVVYSSTLKEVGWNTQLIKTFDPQEVMKWKEQAGRPILFGGGASLAQEFMKHGLIDEYRLVVMPVVIGSGTPLFKTNGQSTKMKYQWSKPFASGAVALCYQPDGSL